jgi:hypothetical protein
VFRHRVTPEGVARAIAAYERMILSGNAPYDRFPRGRTPPRCLPAAKRGLALFSGKARCAPCHAGFNFTDEEFHNLGVGMDAAQPDLGRFTVTKVQAHKGAFKTPTLRDVARARPTCTTAASPRLPRSWPSTTAGAPEPDAVGDHPAAQSDGRRAAGPRRLPRVADRRGAKDIASPPQLPD